MNVYDRYINSKAFPFINLLFVLVIGNLCWFFSTFLGIFIFSFLPASIALFIVIKSAIVDSDFPIIKAFFKIFLKVYWKAQKIFICYLGFGLFLGLSLYLLQYTPSSIVFSLSRYILYILIFILTITLIHTVPIFVYFPYLTVKGVIKNSFLLSLAFPFQTLLLILIYTLSIAFAILFPTIFSFFSFILLFSLIVYLKIKILEPKYLSFVKEDHQKPLSIRDYLKEY